MTLSTSTTPHFNYFVLTDSHGRFVNPTISTPSFTITTTSISGLKWVDSYNHNLSATHLLSTPSLYHSLTSSQSVIFLIGTNSVRFLAAEQIISSIQHFITILRQQHPHLSSNNNITIINCFPCLKPIYPIFTQSTLANNIHQYNNQLYHLSQSLNFRTIDFAVTAAHIGPDLLHLNLIYKYLMQEKIVNYCHCLTSVLTPPPPPVKSTARSPAAKTRRNHIRHEHQRQQQKQFYLIRSINPQWTLLKIKLFLRQHQIKFAKIPHLQLPSQDPIQ